MNIQTRNLIVGITFIMVMMSFTMASKLDISPNYLKINTYPGESVKQNFTITTEGIYTIYLNTSNNQIVASPNNFNSSGGTEVKEITLTFAKDIAPGNYSFSMNGTTDNLEFITETITISSGGTGGGGSCSGGGFIIRKVNVTGINDTIVKEVENNCSEENKEGAIEVSNDVWYIKYRFWIVVGTILLFVISFVIIRSLINQRTPL